MANLDDINNSAKACASNLAAIASAILQTFPRINGTFTLTAAATATVISNSAIAANSIVLWSPANATAALIARTNGLFQQSNTAGSGFTMSTQTGTAVAGSVFNYVVLNPS